MGQQSIEKSEFRFINAIAHPLPASPAAGFALQGRSVRMAIRPARPPRVTPPPPSAGSHENASAFSWVPAPQGEGVDRRVSAEQLPQQVLL